MARIILVNDATSHGGKVISTQSGLTAQGIAVACVGDLVGCPLCKEVYPISEAPHLVKYKGKKLAVAGMLSSCGAVLIASQGSAKIK
ncbi:PAAR domain-containing protein [Candidatus Symbiopectobacterium sp. NZEC127]|uniref:PAAR domain-containing protein n=1 Tax=Candidatus Symbiopectobacterium sp. NZEC127 TaxID=2820472 RepID=UPI0022274425|nr:PAAR domain-containing protein [Candidatus Symbiopectobacterium sp. NZEC127]MCW2485452.1 PAAR domain-containing protein [Candidatus Symbiopectobacterium sp. NZEC127]